MSKPGYNGQFELGERPVANPHPTHRHEEGDHAFRMKTHVALVNLRETPVAFWHARGVVGDAELAAADRIRALFEASEEGIGAVDPGKVRVDGGGAALELSERRAAAAKELSKLKGVISARDRELLRDACQAGMSVQEIGRRWYGCPSDSLRTRRDQGLYVGRRVRDALADLARHWGLDRRRGVRAKRGEKPGIDEREWIEPEGQA